MVAKTMDQPKRTHRGLTKIPLERKKKNTHTHTHDARASGAGKYEKLRQKLASYINEADRKISEYHIGQMDH